ncbi:MAG: hydrogenase nickel incorporation protein HypB [Planctomycetes bacterium]|nr:hydrogenase nickel incorporation protein HypB [Planctomycetota bacterium]
MSIDTVAIQRDIAGQRRQEAAAWRQRLTDRGILCVNLISSPGAGKTSLLQATARHWGQKHRMAVLVGDIATDRDAQRLAPLTPVRQLTTGGACHLELSLVRSGFDALDCPDLEFLFIENVGNLVCPASHDLGEHLRVVVLSVTEGDDKPGKYPKAFRTSQACVINKCDLLPYVPFVWESVVNDVNLVNAGMSVLAASALQETGIDAWCEFLEQQRSQLRSTTATEI